MTCSGSNQAHQAGRYDMVQCDLCTGMFPGGAVRQIGHKVYCPSCYEFMTTEISRQKHPVPLDRHADLVERCMASYHASEQRKARWRIVGYTAGLLACLIIGAVLVWALIQIIP